MMEHIEMNLPLTYEEICGEILRFTDLPVEEIRNGVWEEALSLGSIANKDGRQIGITPHLFDDKMNQLYKTSDAFIFETLVFWAKPLRQRWIKQAYERIRLHAAENYIKPQSLKILILGDGAGSDSLYLVSKGLKIDYFDVPGSRTFDFAAKRFEYYGAFENNAVNPITDYSKIKPGDYDVIISFEVLEHLPDPQAAIRDISVFLKRGGIALVTEAFDQLYECFPTHLESNRRYGGRTGFLFRKNKLTLNWYSRETLFKPMEFKKRRNGTSIFGLWFDKQIISNYINSRFAYFKVCLKNALAMARPQNEIKHRILETTNKNFR